MIRLSLKFLYVDNFCPSPSKKDDLCLDVLQCLLDFLFVRQSALSCLSYPCLQLQWFVFRSQPNRHFLQPNLEEILSRMKKTRVNSSTNSITYQLQFLLETLYHLLKIKMSQRLNHCRMIYRYLSLWYQSNISEKSIVDLSRIFSTFTSSRLTTLQYQIPV